MAVDRKVVTMDTNEGEEDADDGGSSTGGETSEAVSMQVNGSDGTGEPVDQKTLDRDKELMDQDKGSVDHGRQAVDHEPVDQDKEPVDQNREGRDNHMEMMDQDREMVDQEPVDQDSEAVDQDREQDLLIASPQQTLASQQQQQAEGGRQVWRLAEGVCEKRVLVKGQGLSTPCQGSTCQVTMDLPPGQHDPAPSLPGCSLGQGSMQVGEGGTPLSCLIDCALMSMKAGEVTDILLHEMTNVQREIRLHVTLHDFTPATPLWRMTPAEKLASAARHKETGAACFKEGDVFAAFTHFRTATRLLLSILPYSFEENAGDEKTLQQLLCLCFLNLAACQMKTGHHQHVVTNCTQALVIDPSNVKALYRRASAQFSLGNCLLAQGDLELGLRAEPSNRALLELRRTVTARLASSQSQLAQGLSKMFS